GVATLVALAYLPMASYGRWHTRFDRGLPWTLDGEAFLDRAVHQHEGHALRLADDKRLIDWLRRHSAPDEVVLEAQLPEYRWGSRISMFTGRPTLLGYRHHQSQQRTLPAFNEAIELRRQNIEAIYASQAADPAL